VNTDVVKKGVYQLYVHISDKTMVFLTLNGLKRRDI
jgi:hypothetical protein